MAKKKEEPKKEPKITETEDGGFGEYQEGLGGGTPRGGYWGGKNGRVGWKRRGEEGELPEGAHREEQPRTSDGKFTYNSVNGKELKYESRGVTVNPLLTGGENGVKIKDVEKQFREKSGALYDKYSGRYYQRGSEKAVVDGKSGRGKKAKPIYHREKSIEDIWEVARRSFDIEKGEFTGESEVWETKKGRKSKASEAAAEEALSEGMGEKYARGKNGEIRTSLTEEQQKEVDEARDVRNDATEYLRGEKVPGVSAPEAFRKMEGGTPRTFTREELDHLIELAKATAASKILRSRTSLRSSDVRPASPASTPVTPEAPREEIPVGEVKADTSAAPGEEKVYSYNKTKPVKGTAKHSEDKVSQARDLINADDEITDEEKANYTYVLENGSEEDIDRIVDVFVELGIIK